MRLMIFTVVVAHTVACSWFFCHSIISLNSSGCEPWTGCEPIFSWWDNYCGRSAFAIDMGLNGKIQRIAELYICIHAGD